MSGETALKLLKQFGSVENVLDNVDSISGKKLQERVRDHADRARLSKKLATIFRDMSIDIALADLKYDGYDRERLAKFFKKWEFKTLQERIMGDDVTERTETKDILVDIIAT